MLHATDLSETLEPLTATAPKGQQLYSRLEGLLAALQPGELLPSERALAAQFGVARMTVRQQIDELARAGRVTRVMGKGTLVAEPRLTIPPTIPSFSQDIAARGMTPGVASARVEVLPADGRLAEALGVEEGRPVLLLERVRTGDGKPLSLERTHLSLDRFPGLETAPFERISLREHLRDEYGCIVVRAERRFRIATLDEIDAPRLEEPVGAPTFYAEVTTYDRDEAVVEVGTALLRPDRFEIRMTIDTRG